MQHIATRSYNNNSKGIPEISLFSRSARGKMLPRDSSSKSKAYFLLPKRQMPLRKQKSRQSIFFPVKDYLCLSSICNRKMRRPIFLYALGNTCLQLQKHSKDTATTSDRIGISEANCSGMFAMAILHESHQSDNQRTGKDKSYWQNYLTRAKFDRQVWL